MCVCVRVCAGYMANANLYRWFAYLIKINMTDKINYTHTHTHTQSICKMQNLLLSPCLSLLSLSRSLSFSLSSCNNCIRKQRHSHCQAQLVLIFLVAIVYSFRFVCYWNLLCRIYDHVAGKLCKLQWHTHTHTHAHIDGCVRVHYCIVADTNTPNGLSCPTCLNCFFLSHWFSLLDLFHFDFSIVVVAAAPPAPPLPPAVCHRSRLLCTQLQALNPNHNPNPNKYKIAALWYMRKFI